MAASNMGHCDCIELLLRHKADISHEERVNYPGVQVTRGEGWQMVVGADSCSVDV